MALEAELQEALDETGWKPWATSRHVNEDAYLNELVDALHFFVNLFALGGGTADDLYERYCRKNDKNRARQLSGYDGVTGKCPLCRRALDDEAVTCTPAQCSETVQ